MIDADSLGKPAGADTTEYAEFDSVESVLWRSKPTSECEGGVRGRAVRGLDSGDVLPMSLELGLYPTF